MVEKLKGISFEIEGLYFSCFRVPTSTSIVLTYSVPPFTTIRGFLANCLGLKRDDFLLQRKLKIGIQSSKINKTRELSKLLKLKGTGKRFMRNFPSSPIFREFIANPKYKVFTVGENSTIDKLSKAIKDPPRPLYLGQSDDMVDIENLKLTEIENTKSRKIHSILKGIYAGCEITKLPYKFSRDGKNLKYLTVSIPKKYPLEISEEVECLRFGEEFVCVY